MIAAECDIPLPNVSFSDVRLFFESTHTEYYSNTSASKEEIVYKERNNKVYPWQRRIIQANGNTLHKNQTDSYLYFLNDILESLPIKKETRNVISIYQTHQLNYDFNFHYDGDREYGFRICYNLDTSKTFLEFAKLLPEYMDVKVSRKKIESDMTDNSVIHKLVPYRTNTIFCVNGNQYPHRVPIVNHDERVVFIVNGDLDKERFQNLNYLNVLHDHKY